MPTTTNTQQNNKDNFSFSKFNVSHTNHIFYLMLIPVCSQHKLGMIRGFSPTREEQRNDLHVNKDIVDQIGYLDYPVFSQSPTLKVKKKYYEEI